MEFHFHIANLHVHLPGGLPVLDLLTQIKAQGEQIMLDITGLKDAVGQVAQAVDAEKVQAETHFTTLRTTITDLTTQVDALKAQIAAGAGVTQADIDILKAQVLALVPAVDAIDPNAPAPVVIPPVDPPLVP